MALTVTTEDATGPIGGIEGNLSLGTEVLANLRNWSLDQSNDVKKYSSNSTAGFRKTLKGPSEGSGNAEFYLEQGQQLAIEEGKLYAFSGTTKTGGNPWTGVIRIGKINVDVDVEGGDPVSGSLSFEVHERIVQSTGS